jgi:hypothetical protein
MVRGLPSIEHVEHVCDVCLAGKQRRALFPQAAKYRATKPLDLLHGNLCSPISPVTPGGKRYIMLVVDDMSRYMWVVVLTNKSDVEDAFRKLRVGIENEAGWKIKAFRTDRGGGGSSPRILSSSSALSMTSSVISLRRTTHNKMAWWSAVISPRSPWRGA